MLVSIRSLVLVSMSGKESPTVATIKDEANASALTAVMFSTEGGESISAIETVPCVLILHPEFLAQHAISGWGKVVFGYIVRILMFGACCSCVCTAGSHWIYLTLLVI